MIDRLTLRVGLALLLAAGLIRADAGKDEKKPRVDAQGDPLPEGALARLGSSRFRHGDPVSFVALLPGGKAVLSVSGDGSIRVWDLAKGTPLHAMTHVNDNEAIRGWVGRVNRGMPLLASLSPDGKVLATCMLNDLNIRLWDVRAGKLLRKITSPANASGLALSPDGKSIALNADDGSVRLISTDEGKELRSMGREADPMRNIRFFGGGSSLVFSPDGKLLVTTGMELDNGSIKRAVRVFDTASGKLAYRLDGDPNRAIYGGGVAFSPDGKTIASGSGINEVRLFDSANGKVKTTIKINSPYPDSLQFTADGKTLIGRGMNDAAISLWEVAGARLLKTVGKPNDPTGVVRVRSAYSPFGTGGTMSVSGDGKLAACAEGNVVRIVDLVNGKDLHEASGHGGPIAALAWSADGKSIQSLSQDATLRRWDGANGKEQGLTRVPPNAYTFTLSHDGRWLVTEGTDGTTRVVEVATNKERQQIKGEQQFRYAIHAISADGKTLAIRSRYEPITRLYSVETGKPLATLGTMSPMDAPFRRLYQVGAIAFSPDGTLVAAPASETSLALWDVPAGTSRREFAIPPGVQLRDVRFSPDGRSVALDLSDNRVIIYEVATGTERRRYVRKGDTEVPTMPTRGVFINSTGMLGTRTLALSPDGRRVALAGDKRVIHVWDLLTGEELGQLKGHQGDVTALAFSPDSKALASGGEDAVGLVWDMTALKGTKKEPPKLADDELKRLWDELQTPNGGKGFEAIAALASTPAQSIPLLGERLKLPEPVEPGRIDKLIVDLDARRFPTRKKAQDELEQMGMLAATALQKALDGKPSEEMRKRILELLDKAKGQNLTPGQLQYVRALEVLERTATSEARAVLTRLSKGPDGALETVAARAVLSRMR